MGRILKELLLAAGLAVLLSGCYAFSTISPCRCIPVYPWLQYRHAAKNETNFKHYPRAAATITIDTVIAWQHAYRNLRGVVDPVTHRLQSTPEDTLYTLTGRMYYVRHMLDCDYHMEIGSRDTNDTRRIVCEVSSQNCYLQEHIRDTLRARGYGLSKNIPGGLPCVLTGPGFFDGQHKQKKSSPFPSQWEIHPVQTIVFQ